MAGFARVPVAGLLGTFPSMAAIGAAYPPDETPLTEAARSDLRDFVLEICSSSAAQDRKERRSRIRVSAERAQTAVERCVPGIWTELGNVYPGELNAPAVWGARRLSIWCAGLAEEQAQDWAGQEYGADLYCVRAAQRLRLAAAAFEQATITYGQLRRGGSTQRSLNVVGQRWGSKLAALERELRNVGPVLLWLAPLASNNCDGVIRFPRAAR